MARRPKNGSTGPTETVATALIMPTDTVIRKLAKEKRSAKARVGEINGEVVNSIAKAVEDKHVDRKALSIACQLDNLDDERLHVTYFHLLKYIEDLGIKKRAEGHEKEVFGFAKEGDAEADDQPGDDGKVTPIGSAARRVAERAGEPTS